MNPDAIKFWLPLSLSILVPLAGMYANYKVMDFRLSNLEKSADAEEWGRWQARVEVLERAMAEDNHGPLWRAIREIREGR